jgi:predicted dehydrogenase
MGQHGPAAAASRNVEITACCDVREETARRFAERFAVQAVYADFGEMVHKAMLDGVLLATWPNQHREQIERLLAAGVKNILCEKALTLTGKEAMEICGFVRRADAFLMEAFMYRHHPAIRKMDELIAEGAIGAVDSVRAAFTEDDPETADPSDANRNWRQRKECGGGLPYDFTCYCVNACNHFAQALPKRVFAAGSLSKYDTINRLHAFIEYENGRVGFIESSKRADLSQELHVVGATGRLTLPVAWTIGARCDLLQQNSKGFVRYEQHSYSIGSHNSYLLQMENFAAAARGEAEPVMPLAESVVNTFTIEALVASALERRPVDLNVPDEMRLAFKEAR